jgi:hypothetical protein
VLLNALGILVFKTIATAIGPVDSEDKSDGPYGS